MEQLKAGIIQQTNTGNISDNRARLASKIRLLAAGGAQLIILQELHDSLYFCQTENTDLCSLAIEIPSDVTGFYSALALETKSVLVTSMFVVFESDGRIAGKYRKMHIPDDPAYYEKFYFTPGDLGFEPIDTSVGRLGVLVCWDQWFPEAARLMALNGAEILIYPTAIGWESSDSADEKERQRDAWTTVQRGHAIANGLPLIAANRVGHEADPSGVTGGITFWGSSMAVGPQGEFIWRASSDKEEAVVVDIDMKRSEWVRRWWPFLRDRRIDSYSGLLSRYLK